MKIKIILTLGLTVASAAILPGLAQTNVEERLKALEQSVKTLQAENKDLKSQLGWDGKAPLVLVKAGGKEAKLTLGGFVQGQGEFGDVPDARFAGIEDRFLLRRARVNITGSFLEDFDFKLEADFGANSLSEQTGYRAQFTDAFLNWNRYDALNLKFGQFKTPFGFEQLVSDTKLLTIERSLSNDRLTDGRQIGIAASGDFAKKRFGYSAGAFNGSGVNNSFNDNDNFMLAGRIYGVPYAGKIAKQDARWSIGINGLASEDDGSSKGGFGFDSTPGTAALDNLFFGDRTALGVDSQFTWGRFAFEAEWLRAQFDANNNLPTSTLDAAGWYVMGTYYVLPKKLQALMKYESFDPNLDIDGNTSKTFTFGLTYFLKGDDLKFMVNYLYGKAGSAADYEGRLLTRLQFIF